MAQPAAPPGPTKGELGVQEQQASFINKDLTEICSLKTDAPFENLGDAAKRLIPFHILAMQDAAEADWDETDDHSGTGLLCSRSDAWNQLCLQALADRRKRAQVLEEAIHQLHQKAHASTPTTSAIDRYQLELMQRDAAAKQLDRVRPKPVVSPPPHLQHAMPLVRAGSLPRPVVPGPHFIQAPHTLQHPAAAWGITSPRAPGMPHAPYPGAPMGVAAAAAAVGGPQAGMGMVRPPLLAAPQARPMAMYAQMAAPSGLITQVQPVLSPTAPQTTAASSTAAQMVFPTFQQQQPPAPS